MWAFIKYLIIMTKNSNLSCYQTCDTMIIRQFSHFPNMSYKKIACNLGSLWWIKKQAWPALVIDEFYPRSVIDLYN